MDQEEKNRLTLRYAELAVKRDRTSEDEAEMKNLETKLQMSPRDIINLAARLTIPSSN